MTAWLAAAVFVSAALDAEARSRIQTGQDLLDACRISLEAREKAPDARVPPKARHCRQFIDGFFGSLQAMQANRQTRKVHTHEEADRVQCARVPEIASFAQLEQQIVRAGEWNPSLLTEPAVDLVMKAFDTMDPC